MSVHDCPGLAVCDPHPRWHVVRGRGDGWVRPWHVFSPRGQCVEAVETFAEAIADAATAAMDAEKMTP